MTFHPLVFGIPAVNVDLLVEAYVRLFSVNGDSRIDVRFIIYGSGGVNPEKN